MQWLKNVGRGRMVSIQVHQQDMNVLKECEGMYFIVSFICSSIFTTPLRMDSYLLLTTILMLLRLVFLPINNEALDRFR